MDIYISNCNIFNATPQDPLDGVTFGIQAGSMFMPFEPTVVYVQENLLVSSSGCNPLHLCTVHHQAA